jgi:hypothetical protein
MSAPWSATRAECRGWGILGLEGVHHGLERGHREPLQLGALAPELGCAQRHLLLEPLAEVGLLDLAVAPADCGEDRPGEAGEVDRLGEVIHRPALHAQGGGGGIVRAGQHQDHDPGHQLEHLGNQIDGVPAGHADVQQDHVELLPLQQPDRFPGGGSHADLVALLREVLAKAVPDRLVIINDENSDRKVSDGQGGLRERDERPSRRTLYHKTPYRERQRSP